MDSYAKMNRKYILRKKIEPAPLPGPSKEELENEYPDFDDPRAQSDESNKHMS